MKKSILCLITLLLAATLVMGLGACNKTPAAEDDVDSPVRAEGISLNMQHVLAVRGSSITLVHTLSPQTAQGSITYTSSDENVVRVGADGVCTAVGNGVATVTARLDDRYAECRVVVGDIIVDATPSPAQDADTSGDTTPDATNGTDTAGNANGNDDAAISGATANDTSADNGDVPGGTAGDTNAAGDATGDPTDTGSDTATDPNGTNADTAGNNDTNGIDTTMGAGDTAGDTATQTPDDTAGNAASGTAGDTASEMQTVIVGGTATTLYRTVQEALNNADVGKTIVVNRGTYDEDLNIVKTVTLMGVNNPVVKSIAIQNGAHATIRNMTVRDTAYPSAGQAAVHAYTGATLTMEDCVVQTDTTDDLTGGYAILVDKQSGGVHLTGNSLANFRYGIYVCPTSQEVRISGNVLSNMLTGIGLDVRQENAENDYPTRGKIADNEYNEVTKRTQFWHYGENYQGDFDFGDNQEENVSNGNSDTGGSGLLE